MKAVRAARKFKTTTKSDGTETFAECDVIVTMLPQGNIVNEVLLGDGGIAKAL